MPILSAQQKLRELGRIRLGDRSGTRGAPKRLDTFRFTSASRQLIDQLAEYEKRKWAELQLDKAKAARLAARANGNGAA